MQFSVQYTRVNGCGKQRLKKNINMVVIVIEKKQPCAKLHCVPYLSQNNPREEEKADMK